MKFRVEIIRKIKSNLGLHQIDDVIFKHLFNIALVDLINNNLMPKISPFDKLKLKDNIDLNIINNFTQKIYNSLIDEEELLLGLDNEISEEDFAYNTIYKIIEQTKKFLLKEKFSKFSHKDDLTKIRKIKIPEVNENDIFIITGLKVKKIDDTNVKENQNLIQESFNPESAENEIQQEPNQVLDIPEQNYNSDLDNINITDLERELRDITPSENLNEKLQEIENLSNTQDSDFTLTEESINSDDIEELGKININYGEKTALLEDFVDEISFTETEIELDEDVKEEIKPIEEDEEFKSIIQVANEEAYNAVMEQKSKESEKDSIFKKIRLWLIKRRINKKFKVNVKPPKEKKSKKIKDLPKELSEKIIVEPTNEQKQQSEDKKEFFNKGKKLFNSASSKLGESFSIFRMLTIQDWKAGIIFYFSISLLFAGVGAAYWYFYIYKKDFNIKTSHIDKLEPIKIVIIEKDDSIPADEYYIEEINQVSLESKEEQLIAKDNIVEGKKEINKIDKNKQVMIKQMSAWSSYEKAMREVQKYKSQGYESFIEKAIINGMEIYRVKIRTK